MEENMDIGYWIQDLYDEIHTMEINIGKLNKKIQETRERRQYLIDLMAKNREEKKK